MWWVAGLAVAVLVLAGYALWLGWQIHLREQARKVRKMALTRQVWEELDIVCRSILDGGMNITEGAMRLAVRLAVVEPALLSGLELDPVLRLSEATAELAIGEARQTLSSKVRREQDQYRHGLEARYGDGVREAAKALRRLKAQTDGQRHQ